MIPLIHAILMWVASSNSMVELNSLQTYVEKFVFICVEIKNEQKKLTCCKTRSDVLSSSNRFEN